MPDLRVKNDAGDVFFGHAWQLVGEYPLKSDKPQQDLVTGVGVQRVADDMEFDDATFFLQTSCVITRRVRRKQARLLYTYSYTLC